MFYIITMDIYMETVETRTFRKESRRPMFFLCYLQVEREDALVLLVGGGSVLMDQNMSLSGASRVITPAKYSVSVCQTQYVAVMEFKPSASQLDMGGHGSEEQTAFCDTNTHTHTPQPRVLQMPLVRHWARSVAAVTT